MWVALFYCTKIYPIPFILLSPFSGFQPATLPQTLVSSGCPPVPNPILESQPMHDPSSSLLMMPIRARVRAPPKLPLSNSATTLNPSTLQYVCKEPREPIYAIHASRPSEVLRYCPSAIRECKESACLSMTAKRIFWLMFIPRQILVGRQFGLFCVKPSLSSVNVKGLFVCPEHWIVGKCSLK